MCFMLRRLSAPYFNARWAELSYFATYSQSVSQPVRLSVLALRPSGTHDQIYVNAVWFCINRIDRKGFNKTRMWSTSSLRMILSSSITNTSVDTNSILTRTINLCYFILISIFGYEITFLYICTFPPSECFLYFLPRCNRSGTHLSYPMGVEVYHSWELSGWSVKLTTHTGN